MASHMDTHCLMAFYTNLKIQLIFWAIFLSYLYLIITFCFSQFCFLFRTLLTLLDRSSMYHLSVLKWSTMIKWPWYNKNQISFNSVIRMTLVLNLMSHCLRLASFFPLFRKKAMLILTRYSLIRIVVKTSQSFYSWYQKWIWGQRRISLILTKVLCECLSNSIGNLVLGAFLSAWFRYIGKFVNKFLRTAFYSSLRLYTCVCLGLCVCIHGYIFRSLIEFSFLSADISRKWNTNNI